MLFQFRIGMANNHMKCVKLLRGIQKSLVEKLAVISSNSSVALYGRYVLPILGLNNINSLTFTV